MPIIDLDGPPPQVSRAAWRPSRITLLAPLAMIVLALPGERVPDPPVTICSWGSATVTTDAATVTIDAPTGEVVMAYNCVVVPSS